MMAPGREVPGRPRYYSIAMPTQGEIAINNTHKEEVRQGIQLAAFFNESEAGWIPHWAFALIVALLQPSTSTYKTFMSLVPTIDLWQTIASLRPRNRNYFLRCVCRALNSRATWGTANDSSSVKRLAGCVMELDGCIGPGGTFGIGCLRYVLSYADIICLTTDDFVGHAVGMPGVVKADVFGLARLAIGRRRNPEVFAHHIERAEEASATWGPRMALRKPSGGFFPLHKIEPGAGLKTFGELWDMQHWVWTHTDFGQYYLQMIQAGGNLQWMSDGRGNTIVSEILADADFEITSAALRHMPVSEASRRLAHVERQLRTEEFNRPIGAHDTLRGAAATTASNMFDSGEMVRLIPRGAPDTTVSGWSDRDALRWYERLGHKFVDRNEVHTELLGSTGIDSPSELERVNQLEWDSVDMATLDPGQANATREMLEVRTSLMDEAELDMQRRTALDEMAGAPGVHEAPDPVTQVMAQQLHQELEESEKRLRRHQAVEVASQCLVDPEERLSTARNEQITAETHAAAARESAAEASQELVGLGQLHHLNWLGHGTNPPPSQSLYIDEAMLEALNQTWMHRQIMIVPDLQTRMEEFSILGDGERMFRDGILDFGTPAVVQRPTPTLRRNIYPAPTPIAIAALDAEEDTRELSMREASQDAGPNVQVDARSTSGFVQTVQLTPTFAPPAMMVRRTQLHVLSTITGLDESSSSTTTVETDTSMDEGEVGISYSKGSSG